MWLFGVLSLLEMQFLRLIRASYPQDTWERFISKNRLDKAKQMLQERKRRNEAIDLANCLQFSDKRTIVLKSDTLRHAIGFPSKDKGEELLKAFEHLRNELAHAQDIITGRWAPPSHTTQRTGPYCAVRLIRQKTARLISIIREDKC
jgi:hypothetical protein